jgi:hypothetical protein
MTLQEKIIAIEGRPIRTMDFRYAPHKNGRFLHDKVAGLEICTGKWLAWNIEGPPQVAHDT